MCPVYKSEKYQIHTIQVNRYTEDKEIVGLINVFIPDEYLKPPVLSCNYVALEFRLDYATEEWIFWFPSAAPEYDLVLEQFLWEDHHFVDILNKIFNTGWGVIRKNIDPGSIDRSKLLSVICG